MKIFELRLAQICHSSDKHNKKKNSFTYFTLIQLVKVLATQPLVSPYLDIHYKTSCNSSATNTVKILVNRSHTSPSTLAIVSSAVCHCFGNGIGIRCKTGTFLLKKGTSDANEEISNINRFVTVKLRTVVIYSTK